MAVVKDKKDTSVLIETQVPEFVTDAHPKFKQFIEKYYEFMESHQLYFGTTLTFNEPKLQAEDQSGENYLAYENDERLQLESDRDTAGDANVQFTIGETLTGNISLATAVVTGTKGNTVAFIKPSNKPSFEYGERVTGSSTRAFATLANGVVDGTFPKGSIESYRSRGASAAVRDLEPSQDIELTNAGLIDQAWKKEFYVNIPKTAKADRRQLLKHMKKVYKSKGNEASFGWVFKTLFAKEDIEFYYPNTDLLRISDGKWVLDKSIKILTSSAVNVTSYTGRKITGGTSNCTALVERQVTYFSGAIEITELFLSNIIQGIYGGVLSDFLVDETITADADENGKIAVGTSTGIIQNVTTTIGGTNYIAGDELIISGGGGQSARARVTSVLAGVVAGVTTVDSGDGYSVGDPLNFISEETGGSGASGVVKTIIKTGEVLKNTDLLDTYGVTKINHADYGDDAQDSSFQGLNANTHLYGNSSLIFSAEIHPGSEKAISANGFAAVAGSYNSTKHILPGDRIAKVVSLDLGGKTIKQIAKTVTLSGLLTDAERRDVVGGKLTYANSNTNIITGFSSEQTVGGSLRTILTVRDEHVIGTNEAFAIDYASNTYWGTIISANSTEMLYSVGSYYRNPDLDTLSVNNFADLDNIIIYDSKFTKLGTAAAASGVDAHSMHNGVVFQFGNTPVSNTTSSLSAGAFALTSVDVGAIDTFTLTSGGTGYTSVPPVLVANSYIPVLGNALDVIGANNHLLNLNLHSYDTGTIAQSGTTVTLDSVGSFPDANSGVLTLTYANGDTAQVTSITNSSTLIVASDKFFGLGLGNSPEREAYSLSYRAHANNFTKNSLLYNDDYSARGIVLDFIDTALDRTDSPAIANGNTTIRVDMTTVQDFGGVSEYYIFIDNTGPGSLSCVKNGTTTVTTASTGGFVAGMAVAGTGIPSSTTIASITNTTTFVLSAAATDSLTSTLSFTSADVGDDILQEDGVSRIYTEETSSDRFTAHSNSVSTYTTGTITQSGTTVTGVGTAFPNDFVRGTITYADDATSIITGYTNATSFTVADSKTIGSGQTYSISYNPVLTWGSARNITVSAGGTGNRTVTVGENDHSLRTGDKVKITGLDTSIFNGVFSITGANTSAYTYTLPENTAVTSPTGDPKATTVSSAYLATSNGVTIDTSIKGKNAVLEVSTIAIGAVQNVNVYDFGAGYLTAPTVSTVSGDQNATFTATIGALATYAGYNSGTTGTLSGVPKLQDNKYYQAFSYVLKTDFDVADYRDSVKRLTHPSGMVMFGEVAIRSKTSAALFNSANNNVHDLKNLPSPYETNEGRIYHTVTLFQNAATTNVQTQSFGSNNELEIYTADHPWQAMDARLEIDAAVNFQLEAYVEIDSISRINSTMHTVTHTLHGLETGDAIEISGDYTEPHQWGGRHVITSVPTTNTYTIVPKTDVYDPEYPTAVLYDGTLQIRLEDGEQDPDTLTGNNVILEDGVPTYSTVAHKKFTINNLFSVNVAIANTHANGNINYTGDIITNHATFGSASKKFTVTGFNPETKLVVGTETLSNFANTDTIYLHNSTGSNIDVDGGSAINSDLTSVGVYSGVTSPDTFSLIDGINPTHYLKAKTVAYANTFREEIENWDDPFSGKFLVEETQADILITMEDATPVANTTDWTGGGTAPALAGQYIITEDSTSVWDQSAQAWTETDDGYRLSRDGIGREVFDLQLEQGGTFLYPSIQFPEEESGTISIDMSFNSDILLEDDNGAYGWGYLLDETSEGMGNGPQRYISLEEDTEGIEEGHITQSIPYMETIADIELIDSLGYHLITESAVVLLMEDDDILVQENTTSNRYVGGAFYIEDTEFGDRFDSEENLRTLWRLGLETDILLENGDINYADEFNILDNLLTEAGDFIECELNDRDSLSFYDTYENYNHITKPTNLLLEHNSWAVRKLAPVYQYIDHISSEGRLIYEDGSLIANEVSVMKDGETEDESYFYLEADHRVVNVNYVPQVEFHLEDSMDSHIITEDYDHFIEEGDERNQLSRFVTGEPHVKPSLREITFDYPNGNPGPERLKVSSYEKLLRGQTFNDWKDINLANTPYGMQAFRPHYYSQWSSIGLGFVDDNFVMEDNSGILLLEHPVTNQDKLVQEDYPGLYEDIFSTDKARLDFILLENPTLVARVSCVKNSTTTVTTADTSSFTAGMKVSGTGIVDGTTIVSITNATTFVISSAATDSATNTLTIDGEHFDRLQCEDGAGAGLISCEWSDPGPNLLLDYVQEIELEDDTGYILQDDGRTGYPLVSLEGNIISEVDFTVSTTGHTAEHAWKVLPAYQYTRVPTRLFGLIEIADGGTTVTGTEYTSFTTQLKVGEEFQTEDVTIIAEDSGGDVVLETNERIEHEAITLGDADAFTLESTKNIRLQDWRWLISQENDVIAAHNTHTNVTGVYLERELPSGLAAGDPDIYGHYAQTLSNIGNGGDEASAWDTNNESYWFTTHESDDLVKIDKEDSSGVLLREVSEWENINMIWEDYSKMLIIEPQAFIVGSITNDQSLTVTRKHLGGVTEAEYRL